MRDRLIELIRGARKNMKSANSDLHREHLFADYFLENGVMCLPVKVGDKIYQTDFVRIYESTINEITFTTQKMICVTENVVFDETAIGKSIFLTKEEAEQALKGGAE